MTGNTLERRVLLARIGELVWRAEHLGNAQVTLEELRAIEAALRLPAGADWVLVPREPTPEMLDAGWAEGAKLCESGAPDFAAAWTAMLAAAPRHETGE